MRRQKWAPAHAAEEPLRVGSILSVTGPAAFLGEDMKAGLQLAVDEINASNGINGRKIAWTFYDAESQTQKAITETRRLISQDQVQLIVSGGNMSGIALAMAPMTEAAKIPFISSEGALAIVTPVAERHWVFKSTVDDEDVLERIADYLDKKKISKVALIADTSGFGQGAVTQMHKVGPRRNLDVVYETFGPADTDMMPQLTRIRDSDVGAVICWTVTPAGVIFMKQARELGLDSRTLIHSYGFVSSNYMKLAGDAAGSILLASLKLPVGDQLPDTDPLKSGILKLFNAIRRASAGLQVFMLPNPTMPACWRGRDFLTSAAIRQSCRRGWRKSGTLPASAASSTFRRSGIPACRSRTSCSSTGATAGSISSTTPKRDGFFERNRPWHFRAKCRRNRHSRWCRRCLISPRTDFR